MYCGMCGLMSLEDTYTHHACQNGSVFSDSDWIPNLPSSSTSAGAVPAFLASSSSFFLRQSSLDSFCAATADEDDISVVCGVEMMSVPFDPRKMADFFVLEGKPSNATKERVARIIEQNVTESGKLARSLCQRSGSKEVRM